MDDDSKTDYNLLSSQITSDLLFQHHPHGTASNTLKFTQVTDFIDEIVGAGKNNRYKLVLLLYEDPETAKLIEFKFIRSMLKNDHVCACFLHLDDVPNYEKDIQVVEKEMNENDIEVSIYRKNGTLNIIPISPFDINIIEISQQTIQAFKEKIFPDASRPFAGVGIFSSINQLTSKRKDEVMARQVLLEKLSYNLFRNANGVWMCPYYVESIAEALDQCWMIDLLRNHDAVIFLPKLSNGLALRLT